MNVVPIRVVKEAYVVAQIMRQEHKKIPLTVERYTERFLMAKAQAASMDEATLDEAVVVETGERKHVDRLRMYDRSLFEAGIILLADCQVWPNMGNRHWAKGLVPTVAAKLDMNMREDDRLREMMKFAELGLYDDFPIIVYRRTSNPEHYRIDDGNHRAISRYYVGKRESLAFIGITTKGKNHEWTWPNITS